MKSRKSSVNTKDIWSKLFGYKKGDRVRLTRRIPNLNQGKKRWLRGSSYFKKGRIGTICFVFRPPLLGRKRFYLDLNPPLKEKDYRGYCLVEEEWIEIA